MEADTCKEHVAKEVRVTKYDVSKYDAAGVTRLPLVHWALSPRLGGGGQHVSCSD